MCASDINGQLPDINILCEASQASQIAAGIWVNVALVPATRSAFLF